MGSLVSHRLSNRINNVSGSKAAEMSARAAKLINEGATDVISLAVGEPGFNSPESVKEAAIQAIVDNKTMYTPVDGILPLKDAIIRRYQRDYDMAFSRSEICITTGAKHSLHNVFSTILNPEDEVIFFSPFWTSYPDMIKLSDGVPVAVETTHINGFQPEKEKLLSAINNKTKALVLNIPHNPTGSVYTRQTLLMLAELARANPDMWIISDDIYDMLYWGAKPLNLLDVAPDLKDRYVIVNGVSKSYSMAGWRIGYTIGPEDITNAMRKFQSQSLSCASSISQYAAIPAFDIDHQALKPAIDLYQQRVDFTYKRLSQIKEISCVEAHSTFYLFPYVDKIIKALGFESDLEFCLKLLEEKHLAVMPGSAFGASGYLRLSCADDISVLDEAITRLIDFIRQ